MAKRLPWFPAQVALLYNFNHCRATVENSKALNLVEESMKKDSWAAGYFIEWVDIYE